MNASSDTLSERLARLEADIPVLSAPPATRVPHRMRRLAGPAAAAAAVLVAGSAAAGAVAVIGQVRAHEGFTNPGQPFHCSGVEAMAPPVAHRYMTSRGYDVVWQVEERPSGGSSLTAEPPAEGHIAGGFVDGGRVHVVVEVGPGATPRGAAPC